MKTSIIAATCLVQVLSIAQAFAAADAALEKCYTYPKSLIEITQEEGEKQKIGYFQYLTTMMSDKDFADQTISGELKKTSQKIYDADPETAKRCTEDILRSAKSTGDQAAIDFTAERIRLMSSLVGGPQNLKLGSAADNATKK